MSPRIPRYVSSIAAGTALLAAMAAAQDNAKMQGASIIFFGTIQQGNDLKVLDRGGAFFVDKSHVVTSLFSWCVKTKDGKMLSPGAMIHIDAVPAKVGWGLLVADL